MFIILKRKKLMRIYLGLNAANYLREVFKFSKTPTKKDTPQYSAVVGPFRTKRAALFMRDCGVNNPHVQCVADAERIAKESHYISKNAPERFVIILT